MPNGEDFGYDEYYKLWIEALKAAKRAGDITPEEYNQRAADMMNAINKKTMPLEQLEEYYDFKQFWVNRLPYFLDTQYHQAPSGMVYGEGGAQINPDITAKLYSDYWATKSTDMDEGERARLAEDMRQFNESMAWQKQEQEATRLYREEQADIERARLAQENKQQTMEEIRAELENQYETDRLRELSNLGGNPADWIKRWEVKNSPNPYVQTPQSIQSWTQMMANASRRTYATMGTNPNLQNVYRLQAEAALQGANQAAAERWAAGTALPPSVALKGYLSGAPSPTAGSVGGGYTITPNQTPQNAPAPYWLSQFVPNQVTGQPITRQRVGTPSPQTWNATPWSVQQGLSGYADWTGGEPLVDIIGRMESMIPSGGTNTRWLPRRTKTFV